MKEHPSIAQWESLAFDLDLVKEDDHKHGNTLNKHLDKSIFQSFDDDEFMYPGIVEILRSASRVATDWTDGSTFTQLSEEIKETILLSHPGPDRIQDYERILDPLVIEYLHYCGSCKFSEMEGSVSPLASIYSVWATKCITEHHGYSSPRANFICQYPLYVGQTTNLYNRMKSHHRMPEFEFLENCGLELTLYFVEETPFRPIRNNLNELESKLIQLLQPILNNQLLTQLSPKEQSAIRIEIT